MKAFLTFDNKTVEIKADFSLSESNIVLNFENIQLSRAKDFTINKAELYGAGFKIEDFSIFGGKSLIGKTFDAQLQMGVNILEGSLSFSGVKKDEVSANFVYGNLDKLKAFKTLKVSDLDVSFYMTSFDPIIWNEVHSNAYFAGLLYPGLPSGASSAATCCCKLSTLLSSFATKAGITIVNPTNDLVANLYIVSDNQLDTTLYSTGTLVPVKDVMKTDLTASDFLKVFAAYMGCYIVYNSSTNAITFQKIDTFADSIVNIENYIVSFDEKLSSISDGVSRRLELKNSEDFYYLPTGTATFEKILTPINYGSVAWNVGLSTPIKCYDVNGVNFQDLVPIFAPEYLDGTTNFKRTTNVWIASANPPEGYDGHVFGNTAQFVTAIPQKSKILETAKEEGVSIKTTILGNYDRFLELKNKTFEIFGQLFIWKSAQITENLINFELMKFRRWDIEYVPYFMPFVAPEDFTNPADFATYGLTVNLYEKFKDYKELYSGADIAVEFSDAIASVAFASDQIPNDAIIEIFETVSGVETSTLRTTTGTHTFTSGSTKRYMIRRITSTDRFNLPVGSVWAYCFGITLLTGYTGVANPYLKYVFFYENTLTQSSSFRRTGILGTLNIPSGITSLAMLQFSITQITKVVTSNNLTTINGGSFGGAFMQSTSLQIADLGEGLTSIGTDTFNGCTSLASIICRAYNPPTLATDAFRGIPSAAKFYVPNDRVDAYKAATGWIAFESRIYSINDL